MLSRSRECLKPNLNSIDQGIDLSNPQSLSETSSISFDDDIRNAENNEPGHNNVKDTNNNKKGSGWKKEIKEFADWYMNDFSFFDVKENPNKCKETNTLRRKREQRRKAHIQELQRQQSHHTWLNNSIQIEADRPSTSGSRLRTPYTDGGYLGDGVIEEGKEYNHAYPYEGHHDLCQKNGTGEGVLQLIGQANCYNNECFIPPEGTSKETILPEETPTRSGNSFKTFTSSKKATQSRIVKGLSSSKASTKGPGNSGSGGDKNASTNPNYGDLHPQVIVVNQVKNGKKVKQIFKKSNANTSGARRRGSNTHGNTLSTTSDYLKSQGKKSVSEEMNSMMCDVSTISGSEQSPRMRIKFWKNKKN